MHKTGTSSIQESFINFEDESIVYYKDIKGRSNHGIFFRNLIGSTGSDQPRFNGKAKATKKVKKKRKRKLKTEKSH